MKKLLAALFLSTLLPPLLAGAALAQAPDAAAGKTLWEGNNTQCKNCHGKLGEGGFGPDLAGRGLSAPEFQQAVRHPWGVMPTFIDTQVSDAELANMAAYFASLPKNPAPGDWKVPIDTTSAHGKQLLANYGCAQCHGATFDIARSSLGGANADFETFQNLVYKHTDTIDEFEASMRDGPAPAPNPNRPPARIHMGNFNPMRVPESELKQIYDWAHDDIGFRPALQARLVPNGAVYTLNLSNNGIAGKGMVATGLTIDLPLPAGVIVMSATGDGYKGITANGAEWQIAKMAPKDKVSFTVTLSRPVTAADKLQGIIRWAKPAPKTGPNMDLVAFQPAPPAPPG